MFPIQVHLFPFGYVSYIKVSSDGNTRGSGSSHKNITVVLVVMITLLVICVLLFVRV